MTKATNSGVTNLHPNIPVAPYPYQCASTGIVTPGTPVNKTPPSWAKFVKFKLGKSTDDGVPKDAVSFYVRIRYPGDATEASIPTTDIDTEASFPDPDWLEIAPVAGLLISIDITVADHLVSLIYVESKEALGLIP